MSAEFRKVVSLPTPRWTALALLLCFFAGIAATIQWGIGDENASLEVAVNLPGWIAALVFGVWIAGVEFGQDTLRRSLAADPRRVRFILSKLLVLVLVVLGVTIGLNLLGAGLYDLAGSGHEYSIDFELAMRAAAAAAVGNLVVGVVGMGLTLLTRSMAGGLTITLLFVFVIDSAVAFIPKAGDYTLGSATSDLSGAINGLDEGPFGVSRNLEPLAAALVVAAWTLVIFGSGVLRTVRSDVK